MFTESLLESSNTTRKGKNKRWPMTLAFVLESIAACFLLLLPLASTGVIPVQAHDILIAPMDTVKVADPTPSNSSGQRGTPSGPSQIIRVVDNKNSPIFRPAQTSGERPFDPRARIPGEESGRQIDNLMCERDCITIARPPEPVKRLIFSHLSEGLLIRKVDPVYPRTAMLIHVSGAVQLHAIIAKDGSIQSLSVISGHPILAQAALDAVRQWRYKPYILNDEAVEVETFITVNFRPGSN